MPDRVKSGAAPKRLLDSGLVNGEAAAAELVFGGRNWLSGRSPFSKTEMGSTTSQVKGRQGGQKQSRSGVVKAGIGDAETKFSLTGKLWTSAPARKVCEFGGN